VVPAGAILFLQQHDVAASCGGRRAAA
jgi:hypothetical protein